MIVHLDADAFFASVEQAADPKLRASRSRGAANGGGIIGSASYEVRKLGIYTPMPTVRARKLWSRLIIVPSASAAPRLLTALALPMKSALSSAPSSSAALKMRRLRG